MTTIYAIDSGNLTDAIWNTQRDGEGAAATPDGSQTLDLNGQIVTMAAAPAFDVTLTDESDDGGGAFIVATAAPACTVTMLAGSKGMVATTLTTARTLSILRMLGGTLNLAAKLTAAGGIRLANCNLVLSTGALVGPFEAPPSNVKLTLGDSTPAATFCDPPAESDVRANVEYANSTLTGELSASIQTILIVF